MLATTALILAISYSGSRRVTCLGAKRHCTRWMSRRKRASRLERSWDSEARVWTKRSAGIRGRWGRCWTVSARSMSLVGHRGCQRTPVHSPGRETVRRGRSGCRWCGRPGKDSYALATESLSESSPPYEMPLQGRWRRWSGRSQWPSDDGAVLR